MALIHDEPDSPGAAQVAKDPWQALAQASTGEQLCQAWLEVLCVALLRTRAGLVLLGQTDGSFAPVAAMPPNHDLSYLSGIATDALQSREGVTRQEELGHTRLAYPLQLEHTLCGAVVLDLGASDTASVDRAQQLLHWGAGWLVDLLRQRETASTLARTAQGRFMLDTVLALQGERSEREAASALVNRLAREFGCHQVLLGAAGGKTLKVMAVSSSAIFEEHASAIRLATQAMHEAFDQRQTIVWPAPDEKADAARVAVAHHRYAEAGGAAALCSVPLIGVGRVVAVLLMERDRPFTAHEQEYLDTLSMGLSPLLELQREAGQSATKRAARTALRWISMITDGSHPAIKLGVGAALAILLLLALVPAPFRVSSRAVVEGGVQRAAVAPFEGYLREAPARAGDVVKSGQLLALLDDKDLRLEKIRWESELEVALRKEREAMAKGHRVDQRLSAAQANQARAQLDLAAARLARVAVTAPFDGVVVKGDLSQQLGSPIEQGKVLFELAPLDSWRVILKVDERDISHVQPGAKGELVLTSLTGQRWPFTVSKVTPVSVQEDGRNHFRVEADLGQTAPKLSPNMEGVGKIEAGRASLLWAWTRPMVEWARLAWWKLMP